MMPKEKAAQKIQKFAREPQDAVQLHFIPKLNGGTATNYSGLMVPENPAL